MCLFAAITAKQLSVSDFFVGIQGISHILFLVLIANVATTPRNVCTPMDVIVQLIKHIFMGLILILGASTLNTLQQFYLALAVGVERDVKLDYLFRIVVGYVTPGVEITSRTLHR